MPRKRTSRLRAREQGGATRYDGDFRDYTVVGSLIEALKPAGSNRATTDPDVANRLITQRLQQLEKSKRGLDVLGLRKTASPIISHHANPKAQTGEATGQWLDVVEGYLHAPRLLVPGHQVQRAMFGGGALEQSIEPFSGAPSPRAACRQNRLSHRRT